MKLWGNVMKYDENLWGNMMKLWGNMMKLWGNMMNLWGNGKQKMQCGKFHGLVDF